MEDLIVYQEQWIAMSLKTPPTSIMKEDWEKLETKERNMILIYLVFQDF